MPPATVTYSPTIPAFEGIANLNDNVCFTTKPEHVVGIGSWPDDFLAKAATGSKVHLCKCPKT